MQFIDDHALTLEMIPIPDAEGFDSTEFHRSWVEFALTINGYEQDPANWRREGNSNATTASNLTELRCALFHLARQDRWQGGTAPVPGLKRDVLFLLTRIREEVQGGG